MDPSRRRFLELTAAGAAMLALPRRRAEARTRKKPRLEHGTKVPAKDPYGHVNRTATLPAWDGSTSTASKPGSMRMFRGNPAHDYYGSGTLSESPSLLWKFRMSDLSTEKHGKPTVWSGTGWTGQALKHGDYVFVGSTGGHFHCFEAATGAQTTTN